MLIDEITVTLTGGHGGKGAVAWNNIKLHRGPVGGDGARGASIYFEGVADIGMLSQFQSRKDIHGKDGENGKGQWRDGANPDHLILKVPTGTIATNVETGKVIEITKIGQRELMVAGGLGGWGNFKYKSSTNQTPLQSQPGLPGETATFRLDLKLIADVGLIGLPNAGKSSLLNALTSAKAKVGAYQFTTLEPNLGSYYGLIVADIPGLIEGASDGRGLGVKFLKHIERTGSLMHLVSAESDDVVRDYKTIRAELKKYNQSLMEKDEYVFLTKSDTVSPEVLETQLKALKKAKIKATPISVYDDESLKAVTKILNEISEGKRVTVDESQKV
ncbi:GTPase ObgE [Candidatus Kaiserbacteria bacterium]|nr:GTPase ObgE [Candidatus Kaiserbacteria bacterium]